MNQKMSELADRKNALIKLAGLQRQIIIHHGEEVRTSLSWLSSLINAVRQTRDAAMGSSVSLPIFSFFSGEWATWIKRILSGWALFKSVRSWWKS